MTSDGFLFRVMNMFEKDRVQLNTLKTRELNTLNGWIILYVNYMSLRLFLKTK